jgi:hypothetical protein
LQPWFSFDDALAPCTQALEAELVRLRGHCAALEARVMELEQAPSPSSSLGKRPREESDEPLPSTPRLSAWLRHASAYMRSASRGERLAVAVAGLEADLAARSAALDEARTSTRIVAN